MTAPDAESLLRAWESSRGAHLVRRALALLDTGWPEYGLQTWARVPIGERDACLLQLHDALFGAQLQTVAACPSCGEPLETEFTTRDICVQPATLPGPQNSYQFKVQDCAIEYRLANSEDLMDTAASAADATDAYLTLLRRCVIDVRRAGVAMDPTELPTAVVTALAEDMQRNDPGADIRIALNCPACGHGWNLVFDIVSYLWDGIEDWAQRVLADVHVLACAYGWSERDILALSATRRQVYLDMVQA